MALLAKPNPNLEYQNLFETAKKARLPYDKECWLNVAFYLGRQYVEWNMAQGTLRAIPTPKNNIKPIRPVANKIMHFVCQELSSVLQSKPTTDVLPATDEPLDASTAAVAKAYLDWLTDPQVCDFDTVLAEAALWALAGTEGFIKWSWDAKENRGEICSVSPFDVYQDPYVRSFKNSRYIFHSQFMDIEQVYDIYGIEVQASAVEKADPSKTTMMREMGFAPVLQGAVVTELWMKPNRRHPDGLFTVWCGKTTLVPPSPFPYAHKHLPFTQIGSVMMPGNAHRTSAVTFLRAPQMELNKFHAQMIKTREAFANPKWGIDTNIELEADPDDSPDQILRYNTNGGQHPPPVILQPSAMPPNDQGNWIAAEMMDVVGQHEVSQGQVPGRVEAAQAIQLLKEDDDDRLAQMLTSIASAVSEGGWQQLQLAKQYMKAGQLVPIYSSEGLPEIKKFMAEKITPAMKVRVSMGTGLSRSRAGRTDQLNNLWQQGIIRDPDIMAQLLDVPVSALNPDNAFDMRLARNENLTMSAGTPITPNSWDNHDIHRREHNNYRKTDEYQALSNKVKSMFEYHVTTHDKLQIQSLGQELQRQQMTEAVAQGAGFAQAQGPQAAAAPTTNPNIPQSNQLPTPGGPT
jgi:hypothetical protein